MITIPFILNSASAINSYIPCVEISVQCGNLERAITAGLDTGADMFTIPPNLAKKLHFKEVGYRKIGTYKGYEREAVGWTNVYIGGTWFLNVPTEVSPAFSEPLFPLREFELRGYKNININLENDTITIR